MNFYNNKFNKDIIKQLRIALLTSSKLMQYGTKYLEEEFSFDEAFDPENEQMVSEFLLNQMRKGMELMKSEKEYEKKIDELGDIDSLKKCHLKNIYQLQLDEC